MSGLNIRTFRAKSLQAALKAVREELGPDAAILETKPISSGMSRWVSGHRIEVTASSEIRVPARMAIEPSSMADQGPSKAKPPAQAGRHEGKASNQSVHASRPTTTALPSSGITPVAKETPSAKPLLELVNQQASQHRQADGLERLATQRREQEGRPASYSFSPQANDCHRYLWEELVSLGFSAGWAQHLIDESRSEIDESAWSDEALMRGKMARWVQSKLTIGPPIAFDRGGERPYLIGLVGPTGVGKTTTLAKLAAAFTLEERIRVGLITVDTYRVGAVEQLRKYADIMHLPMAVVESESQMRESLRDMSTCQMIFIDTAGRTPRDVRQLEMLDRLMEVAKPDEVHLVLSATSSASSFQHALQRYAAIRPNRMVLSKLDEVRSLGELFPILSHSQLPISYVTTGQNVPEDIEAAQRTRLAAFLLGQCVEFAATGASVSTANEESHLNC